MGPRPLLHADPGPATLGHMGPLRGPSQTEVLTVFLGPFMGWSWSSFCKTRSDSTVRQT